MTPRVLLLTFLLLSATASAQEIDAELARQGEQFLKTYCYRCHGVDNKYPGLNVLDRATLLKPLDAKEDPFLVAGDPAQSRLWDVLETDYMPPEKQKQPSDAENEVFKRWIAAGAHFPAPAARLAREFRGEESLISAILQDLLKLDQRDRANVRYFSLLHQWNDPNLSDDDLRMQRAALSKLLNSLTRRQRITRPRQVDAEGTLLAIDLRDFGWSFLDWDKVLKEYPYGLQIGTQEAENVYEMTDCGIPHIRADWFVAHAARPPLYHALLDIPKNAKALQAELGVDIAKNFLTEQLARAGFQKSGVSSQNRLVERHDTPHGAFWKSYDFKSNQERGNLTRFPLGPEFPDTKNLAAFDHDGGEIIFNLPNGLQAYMLIDGDDVRIDAGPIAVVSDPNQHAGTFEVINGISCMGCHKHGMIPFTDTIRGLHEQRRGQPVANKVLALYPKPSDFQQLVDDDKERFLTAARKATLAFLRTGEDDQRDVVDFEEPITSRSNRYLRNVALETAALELGLPRTEQESQDRHLPQAAELKTIFKFNPKIRRLQLEELTVGQPVAREVWEKAYQTVASELGLGIPYSQR